MAGRRKSVSKEVSRTAPLFDIKVSAATDRAEWEKQYQAMESKLLLPSIEGSSVVNLSTMRAFMSNDAKGRAENSSSRGSKTGTRRKKRLRE